MIRWQPIFYVLLACLVGAVPSAEAQRYCKPSPVPEFINQSQVALFVSGSSSGAGNYTLNSVSHLNYLEMTNHNFPGIIAAFRVEDARVSREEGAEQTVRVQFVTGRYFDVLDVTPQMGRMIEIAEDAPENAPATAVISDHLWMSMFQLDPDVVGRRIKVNGRRAKIVGVAPPGFTGVLQSSEDTIWFPGAGVPGAGNRTSEGYAHFVVTLGDEITWDEAGRFFRKVPALLVNAFPDVNQKFKTISFYNLGLLSCPSQ